MGAVKIKITPTGFGKFKGMSKSVFEGVKDAMDDIRDDLVDTSESLAPYKTGKLEKSHRTRRTYKQGKDVSFTISYKAMNRGFDYAEWTHDKKYKLGAGSRAKQPKKSRFSKTAFRVGRQYLKKVVTGTAKGRSDFIQHTINRKLKQFMVSGASKD